MPRSSLPCAVIVFSCVCRACFPRRRARRVRRRLCRGWCALRTAGGERAAPGAAGSPLSRLPPPRPPPPAAPVAAVPGPPRGPVPARKRDKARPRQRPSAAQHINITKKYWSSFVNNLESKHDRRGTLAACLRARSARRLAAGGPRRPRFRLRSAQMIALRTRRMLTRPATSCTRRHNIIRLSQGAPARVPLPLQRTTPPRCRGAQIRCRGAHFAEG